VLCCFYCELTEIGVTPIAFSHNYVLECLITVGMQNRQWDSTVFNDMEEVGNQMESRNIFSAIVFSIALYVSMMLSSCWSECKLSLHLV